jgi:hypothetical protein
MKAGESQRVTHLTNRPTVEDIEKRWEFHTVFFRSSNKYSEGVLKYATNAFPFPYISTSIYSVLCSWESVVK